MTNKAVFARVSSPIFTWMVAGLTVVVIISNIGATKGITFGPIVTDGGFFLFPLAYIIGDVISEVYGWRNSRRSVLITFVLSAFAAACFWIIIALPAAEWYDGQSALERTLGPVWLIVVASLLGFASGQLLNALVLVKLKERFGEQRLVTRVVGSSVVGQFVDTLVFCSIAASVIGISDAPTFLNYLAVGFGFKLAVEIVFLPATVAAIKWVKRSEPSYGPADQAHPDNSSPAPLP